MLEVEAHDGSTVTLLELRGKKVALWFYPKASPSHLPMFGDRLHKKQVMYTFHL
jgi:peroxiredoxin